MQCSIVWYFLPLGDLVHIISNLPGPWLKKKNNNTLSLLEKCFTIPSCSCVWGIPWSCHSSTYIWKKLERMNLNSQVRYQSFFPFLVATPSSNQWLNPFLLFACIIHLFLQNIIPPSWYGSLSSLNSPLNAQGLKWSFSSNPTLSLWSCLSR